MWLGPCGVSFSEKEWQEVLVCPLFNKTSLGATVPDNYHPGSSLEMWLGFSSRGLWKKQIIWTHFSWLSDCSLMQRQFCSCLWMACGEAGIGVVWPSFRSLLSQQLLIRLITGIRLFISKWCSHKGERHMTTLCSNGNSPYCLCLSENCGLLNKDLLISCGFQQAKSLGMPLGSCESWVIHKQASRWENGCGSLVSTARREWKLHFAVFAVPSWPLPSSVVADEMHPAWPFVKQLLTMGGPHEGPVWPLEKGPMQPATAFWRASPVTPHQQEEEDSKGQLEVAEWVVIKRGLSECFVFNDVMNFSPQFLRHV